MQYHTACVSLTSNCHLQIYRLRGMCWKKSTKESMAEMKSFDNRGYMDTEGGGGSDYNANNKVSLLIWFVFVVSWCKNDQNNYPKMCHWVIWPSLKYLLLSLFCFPNKCYHITKVQISNFHCLQLQSNVSMRKSRRPQHHSQQIFGVFFADKQQISKLNQCQNVG